LLPLKSNIVFKAKVILQASPPLSTQPLSAMADPVTPKNKSIPLKVPATPAVKDAVLKVRRFNLPD
jgi:hypothetical protein